MFFNKQSLKINILSSILTILFSTVLIVTIYSYVQNKKAISNISNNLFQSISSDIISKTVKYLKPLSKLTIASAKLLNTNMPANKLNNHFFKYGKAFLEQYPQQTMFYIGNEKKEFTAIYQKHKGLWKTKNIYLKKDSLIEVIEKYDTNSILKQRSYSSRATYDPTTRPWYKGTKNCKQIKIYWSDVYIFSTAQKPGVTASYPMYNEKDQFKGVIGSDIRIDKISDFLKSIKVSKNGEVFLVNNKRQIIGYHDIAKAMIKDGNKFRPAYIEETLDSNLIKAFDLYQINKKTRFDFTYKNKDYLCAVLNFPGEFQKKWNVVLVAPKDDFFSSLNRVNYLSLIISFVVLLFSIFISYLVSTNISKPIEELTKETKKIEEFYLDGEINIKSRILEVSQMVDSVQKMKNGLISFKRYVPDSLVRKLIKTGEIAKIGGSNREVSILFTDIYDFTKITDNYSSEIIFSELYNYFNLISKIILENMGTIDKYLGDSVMAFWNAPEINDNFVLDCCITALKCQQELINFNNKVKEKYNFTFNTRFTIHTGNVIVGNIGSEERLNYSILGDSVNVANRLTKFNIPYNAQIIVSEITYKRVKDQFIFNYLGEEELKGKKEKVKIYELLDFKP